MAGGRRSLHFFLGTYSVHEYDRNVYDTRLAPSINTREPQYTGRITLTGHTVHRTAHSAQPHTLTCSLQPHTAAHSPHSTHEPEYSMTTLPHYHTNTQSIAHTAHRTPQPTEQPDHTGCTLHTHTAHHTQLHTRSRQPAFTLTPAPATHTHTRGSGTCDGMPDSAVAMG